jgi:hypothetical protein
MWSPTHCNLSLFASAVQQLSFGDDGCLPGNPDQGEKLGWGLADVLFSC